MSLPLLFPFSRSAASLGLLLLNNSRCFISSFFVFVSVDIMVADRLDIRGRKFPFGHYRSFGNGLVRWIHSPTGKH